MITREIVRAAFPVVPLDEVVEFLDHRRKPVKQSERVEGIYPYYGANGQQGTIDGYLFDEPLVLVAEDGGHFGDPDRGIAYRVNGKIWVNNHAHVLRPKACIDIRFLTRVLENYDVGPFINGSTRAKLTKAQAKRIEIPLPPLEEQKRIAGILDQAADLCRLRTRALDKLDTLGQAIFHEMFGDVAQNSMGFRRGTIGDLAAETQYGTSEKASETGPLPVLRMNNLTYDGRMDLASLKYMDLKASDFAKYTVVAGDMLFNRTNSPDLVGKTAVYRGQSPMAFAGYLVRLRANAEGNTEYISAVLNSAYGKATLRGMCKSIIGMANINAKELCKISLPIPPRQLQDAFSNRLAEVDKERLKFEAAIAESNTLFASLQHRAFRGEL
ncbi:restriction endonuclease subunit S [Komagataeibacter oboediens]|uniref:Restriction endonuclease subunit S n=1 Tax=Komagataeibacter oboediens TaxID=65958 RepID=A0ABS5SR94_9PROT|nr:restriction endonuclease subunit S [Komagataeibacter oboediens]MBL7234167.1 restriction endonuclease subunit S [Komagataeibacter oboediens]MBT0676827.1 restriction endonuclease subunit S [Komagataeibacter oboediens]MBT0680123.1 restriction endonuclease subunit S [Komagataeibacter oboediens]